MKLSFFLFWFMLSMFGGIFLCFSINNFMYWSSLFMSLIGCVKVSSMVSGLECFLLDWYFIFCYFIIWLVWSEWVLFIKLEVDFGF